MLNLIPFLVFLILLWTNCKIVGRIVCMSNFILLLYTISMLCFFLLATWLHSDFKYSFKALLLVVVVISVLIQPLSQFEKKTLRLQPINYTTIKILAYGLIVLGLYSLAFYAKHLPEAFAIGVADLRSEDMFDVRLYQTGLFSKVAAVGAYLFPISLFLVFYNMIFRCLSSIIIALLIVSTFSYIACTLNVGGRDGIIIWLLVYGALLSLFYKDMSRSQLIRMIKPLVYAIALVVPIFIFISQSRFGDSDAGTMWWIVTYMGEQLDNLTHNLEVYSATKIGNKNPFGAFSLITQFLSLFNLNIGPGDGVLENMSNGSIYGYRTNKFAFFIGSFYPYGMNLFNFSLVVLLVRLVYSLYLRPQVRSMSYAHVMVAFVWYTIPLVGVFYFYHGSVAGNMMLFAPILIAKYLKTSPRSIEKL